LTDIERIGTATGRPEEARQLVAKLRARLEAIHAQVAEAPRPKVACLEWLDPLFAAGHWVPEMVAYAGGDNVLGSAGEPSMRITWQQLLDASPDVLICMPCGFTAERTVREAERLADHPHWKQLPAVRHGQTYAVDAVSYFSRPGPRLIEGVAILAAAFHPSLFGRSMPEGLRRLA
jgi:iron complex transport system substrate-binding protein